MPRSQSSHFLFLALSGAATLAALLRPARAETVDSIDARTVRAVQLCEDHRQGTFLRKLSRIVGEGNGVNDRGELDFVPATRHTPGQEDYLPLAIVKDGKRIYPYSSFSSPGLFISRTASFGLFYNGDLASPTKQRSTVYDAVTHAKQNTPHVAFNKDVQVDLASAIQVLDQAPQPSDYNEALVDYSLADILGLYVEVPERGDPRTGNVNNTNEEISADNVLTAVRKAELAHHGLVDRQIYAPLTRYTPSDGRIAFYRSVADYVADVHAKYCGPQRSLKLAARYRGQTTLSDMSPEKCSELLALGNGEGDKTDTLEAASAAPGMLTCEEVKANRCIAGACIDGTVSMHVNEGMFQIRVSSAEWTTLGDALKAKKVVTGRAFGFPNSQFTLREVGGNGVAVGVVPLPDGYTNYSKEKARLETRVKAWVGKPVKLTVR